MVVVFFFKSQNLLGLCPKHNYKETHAQPCDKETLFCSKVLQHRPGREK